MLLEIAQGGSIMDTQEAIAHRIRQLCQENNVTPNKMSKISGIPQTTIKSILLGESKNPGCNNIKKLWENSSAQKGSMPCSLTEARKSRSKGPQSSFPTSFMV